MLPSATPLSAAPDRPQVPETAVGIGLDIGGTKISAARVSLKDGMQAFNRTSTPSQGPAFVAAITELVQPLMSGDSRPSCLGIASAGTVNSETGDIFGSTGNLPALRDIPSLRQSLEAALGLPVVIENDANAAAYGEARLGAAQGHADVLMITLGTGVGAGFLINHQLVRGAHFAGAEAGHIAIGMKKERLCTCGRWDCWETFASGTGLAETARRELTAAPSAQHSAMLADGKTIPEITTHDLIAAWQGGDFIAKEIMNVWHYHIATGLGSLLNVLDPAITVVGGGMAQFVDFDILMPLVKDRSMFREINVVPATLGNEAGIVGAAMLALERVHG